MKRIFITNGCPFSGKSTWALQNFATSNIIESDFHKYDSSRNGDLAVYLSNLANLCEGDCVIVQTNNSFKNFQHYKELLNGEMVVVNFELSLEQIKENRACSHRYKRNFKKSDRLEWYYKIWQNSLEQIKQCKDWTCISVHKKETSELMDFME